MRGFHIRIALHKDPSANLPYNSIETFVPKSLFQPLPTHTFGKPIQRRNTLTTNCDYRKGQIRIDWMDIEKSQGTQPISGKEKDRTRGPVEATFVPCKKSKNGTTNLPEGIVHLYRDSTSRPSQEELTAGFTTLQLDDIEADGVMLGVLAVPSWMTPSDFLSFVAPASEGIAHLRIIRDSAPNRSIVVIKFPNPADAAEFVEAYNGKPFNSMEPEICHVVHVLSVMIDAEDSVSQAISRLGSKQGPMYELPTCPVCLERMDSAVTGLITVPCSHTFHCMCLSKWGDSRCPVCRYSQTLLSSHPSSSSSSRSTHPIPFANPATPTLSSCSSCSSTSNLWICLICGNIGCGRYGQAHAQAHYQATTHLYALELETQRVWDYAGDGYVHRLIQNKADGKLVELPSAAASMGPAPREGGLGPSPADALSAEKIEAIGIEYSYLLTSQLDSQRSYYEEQTAELKNQVIQLTSLVECLSNDVDLERKRFQEELHKRQKEQEEIVTVLLKEKSKIDHRSEKALEMARKFEKELREEKAVSEGLLKNLTRMKDKAEDGEKEKQKYAQRNQELEDQVRDVMFFLEAKTKIEQGDGLEAEAAGGSIEVPVDNPISRANTKKKVRKR